MLISAFAGHFQPKLCLMRGKSTAPSPTIQVRMTTSPAHFILCYRYRYARYVPKTLLYRESYREAYHRPIYGFMQLHAQRAQDLKQPLPPAPACRRALHTPTSPYQLSLLTIPDHDSRSLSAARPLPLLPKVAPARVHREPKREATRDDRHLQAVDVACAPDDAVV